VTFSCPLVLPTYTTTGTDPNTVTTLTNPGSCNDLTIAPGLLVTLTVYNTGLNTANWQMSAPSASGTPDVIHCGPGYPTAQAGGSVCTATYPIGTTVTITQDAPAGSFGGWSWNCGSNLLASTCTITLGDSSALNPTSNVSVGAIFN
jgi:hypothetical protein